VPLSRRALKIVKAMQEGRDGDFVFPGQKLDEPLGKVIDRPDRPIRRSQQQGTGVRRDRAAVKSATHTGAAFHRCKIEQCCATLCRRRVAPRIGKSSFSQNNFRMIRTTMRHVSLRYRS
jgi:hypothetical protein